MKKITKGKLVWNGEVHQAKDLSEKYNISLQMIRWRLRQGWSIKKTLTTPIGYRNTNTLKQKAKARGINHITVRSRISRGIPEHIALEAAPGTLPRKKLVRVRAPQEKELYNNIWEFKLWTGRVDQAVMNVQKFRITRALK